MTLEKFNRIVQILANQSWVRYYLHWVPDHLVLEIAKPARDPEPERLHLDLVERGFKVMPCEFPCEIAGLRIYRWIVPRTPDPAPTQP